MPLPILTYHEISERDRYSIAENKFAEHMAYLSNKGYKSLVTADLGRNLTAEGKAVMITFDDGYITDYTKAYPIMNKYGFKAVCFLTTAFIGTDRYLSWEQAKELQKNGFDLQSHTHTHPLLTTLSLKKVKEELTVSKNILEQKLGKKITALSLPGGSLNKTIASVAKECGYDFLFTSIPQINIGGGPVVYHRIMVKSGLSLADFGKTAKCDRIFYRKSRVLYEMRKLAKNIIGPDRYLKVWRKLYKESV